MLGIRISFFIILILFFSARGYSYITVKSVKTDKNALIIKLSEQDEVAVGTALEYKNPKGNSCLFKVTKVNNMAALAEATMCDDISIVKPGKMLEVSDDSAFDAHSAARSDKAQRSSGSEKKRRKGSLAGIKIGVRLYYSTATEIYSSYKAFGSDIKFIDKTAGAPGLGLNISYITASSFMFGLNASYEMERKLISRQFSNSTPSTYTNGEAISLIVLDLNLGYVFKNTGILFAGLNTNSPMLSNMDNIKVAGGVSYHFGIAYLATPNLSVDVVWRYLNLSMTESSIKYDVTQFDGACVGLGYTF